MAGFLRSAEIEGALAANEMALQLETHSQVETVEMSNELRELLQSETFFESLSQIESMSQEILNAYRRLYEKTHDARTAQCQDAIEKIKGRQEWEQVPESHDSSHESIRDDIRNYEDVYISMAIPTDDRIEMRSFLQALANLGPKCGPYKN
jgi:hypothetical protein